MLALKTRQMFFNSTSDKARDLIRFCYFLILLVLISCNETTQTKERETSEVSSEENTSVAKETSQKSILFFGDSITAGYGLDDSADAYPGIIQSKIDSLGLDYQVVNSGVSGETTAGGLSRIKWVLNQDIDVFVLELGANDGLRGVPLSETRKNLQAIIDAVQTKNAEIQLVLAGMQLPPNMGQEYTSGFKAIFSDLAEENDIALIPFILEDVGGIPDLNQRDGIHPTEEGHKIVANTVWETVGPIIEAE